MRTVLRLAFDGAPFCGWQIQPRDRTAQGDLNDALSKLLNQAISSMGSGRTDTGVHAKEMYVHFDWEPELATSVKDMDHLVHRLNRFLAPAIRVFEAREVADDWHARFDAVSRSYEYYMCDNGSPFHQNFAWMIDNKPDVSQMNAAASLLLKEEDFASFCKCGSDNKTTLCDITEAKWVKHDDIWVFHITADRFLRNMVRAIVGSLYEVGRGKWTVQDFQSRLQQKNRGVMGTSAPAHGLYLSKVTYNNL
ncbi:MAG TPA: tRNA pseudouridine(38-40) synthase TruA [Cryomorphaceae bacterium]|nr:tRNA pseudouridine(38-40) synthase TruA [Cryomorphaceae bacterium]|tara:strand:+ start:3053 stop:3802 length:750 start_codon:yes stop_codon:yes gene_type:complete